MKDGDIIIDVSDLKFLKFLDIRKGSTTKDAKVFYKLTHKSLLVHITRLEQRGLIKRERYGENMTSKRILLTNKGISLVKCFFVSQSKSNTIREKND